MERERIFEILKEHLGCEGENSKKLAEALEQIIYEALDELREDVRDLNEKVDYLRERI